MINAVENDCINMSYGFVNSCIVSMKPLIFGLRN